VKHFVTIPAEKEEKGRKRKKKEENGRKTW
jgi:hypothetical protein